MILKLDLKTWQQKLINLSDPSNNYDKYDSDNKVGRQTPLPTQYAEKVDKEKSIIEEQVLELVLKEKKLSENIANIYPRMEELLSR